MNREEELFMLLRRIIKNMRRVLDREIGGFGFGHAEMRLLVLLYASGDIRQEELTAKIEVDRSNVGRALKKLESLGLIERKENPEDRRSLCILLTSKGRELEKPLQRIISDIERTMSANIEEGQMDQLLTLLRKVDSGMSEKNYRRNKDSE